jgi:ABC-type multidrug transport system fused ATPase/permease subunit
VSHEIALEEEFARTTLNRKTLRRLLSYFKPHRGPLIGALVMEVFWVLSMLVDPSLVHHAVDGPLGKGDISGTMVFVGLMAFNVLFRATLTAWELRITTRIGVAVQDAVRRDVFNHIQRLSMRYFDRNKQGRIIARADRDVDTLEQLIMWGPIVLVSLVLSMVFGLGRLATLDAGLAFWFVLALPGVWVLTRLFHRWGLPAYRRVRETNAAISSRVAEVITGVRVVQAFSAEPREHASLALRQSEYRAAIMRGAHVAGSYIPALSLIFNTLLIAILFVGGQNVAGGTLSIGSLLEFIMLIGFVVGPVEGLGNLYNQSMIAGAAAERIFLLLDTDPEVKDGADVRSAGRLKGRIAFENVSFSYDPEAKIGWQLEDVDFVVEPGTAVALVGHTGAGKTSIINLVGRFYEAQRGIVSVDGRDIRTLPLAELHQQTGMVLQENFLFAGSVLENLRFVRPGLTEEDARRGFTELGCDEILDRLKGGLDTDVGERGANLSEGERQIVCFVRALLADPSILILDEATSAVDTRTEALILRALHELAHHQTTFIIAHRLSTIRDADKILVMEHGKLVEQGTHDELFAYGGVYTRLYSEYVRE